MTPAAAALSSKEMVSQAKSLLLLLQERECLTVLGYCLEKRAVSCVRVFVYMHSRHQRVPERPRCQMPIIIIK